jgi:hypothetical protein
LEAKIMKRYLIPTVAVLMVLTVAWAAFGQAERRGGRLSEEERAKMRERFQNMSEDEREQFRARMRERGARGGFIGREDQEKAIKVIQGELAKLKAAQTTRPTTGFQNLSEDERAKLREKMTKVRQERQQALQTIIAQVARLQGRRQPPAEGGQYLIINVGDLKPIQAAAKKEKAKETAQLLERLIARGSGRRGPGGRPPGSRTPGSRTPGSRTPGGQRGPARQGNP